MEDKDILELVLENRKTWLRRFLVLFSFLLITFLSYYVFSVRQYSILQSKAAKSDTIFLEKIIHNSTSNDSFFRVNTILLEDNKKNEIKIQKLDSELEKIKASGNNNKPSTKTHWRTKIVYVSAPPDYTQIDSIMETLKDSLHEKNRKIYYLDSITRMFDSVPFYERKLNDYAKANQKLHKMNDSLTTVLNKDNPKGFKENSPKNSKARIKRGKGLPSPRF